MVKAYESVKCNTTSYIPIMSVMLLLKSTSCVEEEADSVPELLKSKEDVAQ